MINVSVNNFKLIGTDANPTEVEFSVSPNFGIRRLPITSANVVSHRPLKVRVTIPPFSRIYDMQQYDGQEVILVPY
jgi:hypothetical protein